ncbi:LytR C-terminal domain-containing protein [Actinomyces minihominis]|uniref:LytR C-terminal domain-containing protein n=1 Tax=Actinomyces minihominis TaxID=2002838 RepID=UPI000C0796C9|nr:LytR C-terminal domain-containing protein [Actinomyces minihominis]
MSNTYPSDDFDNIPQGAPAGVHRRVRSPWAPVIPFLLVLVLVPLLAWGVASLIQSNVPKSQIESALGQSSSTESEVAQSSGGEEATQSGTPELPETGLPSAAPDDPNEVEEEVVVEEPGAEVVTDFAHPVAVLNGTGIAGYAGEIAGSVMNVGFTNVIADNAVSFPSDVNTVFYPSADLKATAEAVAAAAGIDTVVEEAFADAPDSIVVYLIN